jgi:hypothetical protein
MLLRASEQKTPGLYQISAIGPISDSDLPADLASGFRLYRFAFLTPPSKQEI